MSTAFILSAGKASRLKGLAPADIKAFLRLGYRSWWEEMIPKLKLRGWNPKLVLHESKSSVTVPFDLIPPDFSISDIIFVPDHRGPGAAAFEAVTRHNKAGPVMILYADTILGLSEIPYPGETAVLVADPWSYDRAWEWHGKDNPYYAKQSKTYAKQEGLKAAIGCYVFGRYNDVWVAAERAVIKLVSEDISMADVIRAMDSLVPLREVQSWQDVGTLEALEAYRERARETGL